MLFRLLNNEIYTRLGNARLKSKSGLFCAALLTVESIRLYIFRKRHLGLIYKKENFEIR